jgi:hypothetical protein
VRWILAAGSNEVPGVAGGQELAGRRSSVRAATGSLAVEVLGIEPDPASVFATPVLDDPVVDLSGWRRRRAGGGTVVDVDLG